MKRFSLLFSSVLLLTTAVCAQTTPWATLPASKKVETIMGDEKPIYLKLDTLVQKKGPIGLGEPFSFEKKIWYSATANKIGYGYITATGKPIGIWRYYTLIEGKYELFCEGSFQSLEVDNLFIDEELVKKYASLDKDDTKTTFANSLEQKAFFAGEWRFYKNGKLDHITIFDEKVQVPLDEVSIMDDPSGNVSTRLVFAVPEKIHLAGKLVSTIHFSPEGWVTSIYANGINLAFAKDGKPVIEPLVESLLIE